MMETSKRQQRKAQRAKKNDKHGISMSLSRRQRRAIRRNKFDNQFNDNQRGNTAVRLTVGQTYTAMSGHVHHYSGANRVW